MGYICPSCGEGLPEDTPCPCTMGSPDDEDDEVWIRGPLTSEIGTARSPVRRFLTERFASGLRDLQRQYRESAPALAVPPSGANPGTVGTAADWLLKFLLHPRPSLAVPHRGARLCDIAQHQPDKRTLSLLGDEEGMLAPLRGIALSLGLAPSEVAASPNLAGQHSENRDQLAFTGPVPGSVADAEHLARACWALALFTEVFRGGPVVAAHGPLGQFEGRCPSAAELLDLAPSSALGELAGLRQVFETVLLPRLAVRRGPWRLGPTFTGSALIRADADLIAAGLLLDLKTSANKPSLAIADLFQVIGYALLDFDDEYKLTELGIFSARYAYLATWQLGQLLEELAGHQVSLQATRQEFRQLLLTHRS